METPQPLGMKVMRLFFRLLGHQASITLYLKQYLDAYFWYALTADRIVLFGSIKSTAQGAPDASNLRAVTGQVYTTNHIWLFKFYFSSNAKSVRNTSLGCS
jgi:hypothetical protein